MGANRIQQFNVIDTPVSLDASQGLTETAFFLGGEQVFPIVADSATLPDVPDSEATTVEDLVADYNTLLQTLRDRKILAPSS